MAKKKKGGKKGKKIEIIPDTDWADEEHFDRHRIMIHMEYCTNCKVFAEQAGIFYQELCIQFPESIFQLLTNSEKVKKTETRIDGIFKIEPYEIMIAQNARSKWEPLWSGVQRGPPRREKFPAPYEFEVIWKKVQQTIQQIVKEDIAIAVAEAAAAAAAAKQNYH